MGVWRVRRLLASGRVADTAWCCRRRYAAVHRVPSADLNEFLKEKRRQEELELQAAAELNRRGAHGSGYYAQRCVASLT